MPEDSIQAPTYDWPPVEFANNDHILVWWLPEYDAALHQWINAKQWRWTFDLSNDLRALVPDTVLKTWLETDPLCKEYSWSNVLTNFAIARAKQQGWRARAPETKQCIGCREYFEEASIDLKIVARVGVDRLDFCGGCFRAALSGKGDDEAAGDTVIGVFQVLMAVLGRDPVVSDLNARFPLAQLSPEGARAVIKALLFKPSRARLTALFGSCEATVTEAKQHSNLPLPDVGSSGRRSQKVGANTKENGDAPQWTFEDTYRNLIEPLPKVRLDQSKDPFEYRPDIVALEGTGALRVAEAMLFELSRRDVWLNDELSYIYSVTDRREAAHSAVDAINSTLQRGDQNWREYIDFDLRDPRTITRDPVFYQPLPDDVAQRPPVNFVLVGGEIEMLSQLGKLTVTSGEAVGLAQSVSAMLTMCDDEHWIGEAVDIANRFLQQILRASDRGRVHYLGYVTGRFRDAVKRVTGEIPTKLKEDIWTLEHPKKGRWEYAHDPKRYIYNAHANGQLIELRESPEICVWAWPDRSDMALGAFLGCVARGATAPLTLIAPDVPHFRDFARRYCAKLPLTNIERTLIEDGVYHGPRGGVPFQRGLALTCELAPTFVLRSDGKEIVGTTLCDVMAYLEAMHEIRVDVWDAAGDPILVERSKGMARPTQRYEADELRRADMVQWYERYQPFREPALFEVFRPSILGSINGQ